MHSRRSLGESLCLSKIPTCIGLHNLPAVKLASSWPLVVNYPKSSIHYLFANQSIVLYQFIVSSLWTLVDFLDPLDFMTIHWACTQVQIALLPS